MYVLYLSLFLDKGLSSWVTKSWRSNCKTAKRGVVHSEDVIKTRGGLPHNTVSGKIKIGSHPFTNRGLTQVRLAQYHTPFRNLEEQGSKSCFVQALLEFWMVIQSVRPKLIYSAAMFATSESTKGLVSPRLAILRCSPQGEEQEWKWEIGLGAGSGVWAETTGNAKAPALKVIQHTEDLSLHKRMRRTSGEKSTRFHTVTEDGKQNVRGSKDDVRALRGGGVVLLQI